MWKPVFCAGFQALWGSWESPPFDFSTISTTRHFHSEPDEPAKSAPLRRWTGERAILQLIGDVLESRVECILLQILAQSRFFNLPLPLLFLLVHRHDNV